MQTTFFWHDYETFGANPAVDRPSQFAGIRTDLDLNIIGEPITLYCKPPDDYLPDPQACLITGITPQQAAREGVSEREFIATVLDELGRPGTCGLGYNTLRFDDEVTRHTLYRNLYDPYEREYKNGNSRWDLIDVVRLAYAVRPEGIEWPMRDDGSPSFRLEDLTRANGLTHEQAHDAMSDVHATIGMARLLKARQPRLFDFAFKHRDKQSAGGLLDLNQRKPVLHISSRFPARQGCAAIVMPLCASSRNRNAITVIDLRFPLEGLNDLTVEEIRSRVFVANDALPEGVARIPLKQVHLNKCPVLAPLSVLKDVPAQRLAQFELDPVSAMSRAAGFTVTPALLEKLEAVFNHDGSVREAEDPEAALYSGGFIADADRRILERCRLADPWSLAALSDQLKDERLREIVFRYRARNYPETLEEAEGERWEAFRRQRLIGATPKNSPLRAYFEEIQRRVQAPDIPHRDRHILEDLYLWGESLVPYD